MKLNNYYSIQGYEKPLKFMGLLEGDYICDYCNRNHYNSKALPKLYWFEVSKDTYTKYGTSCINKVTRPKA